VVYGRCLLPSRVKVPLTRFMVKAQRATEEMEEGFRQEWEELETECLRLSDWEHGLRDCYGGLPAAKERAQLKQEHDVQREKLRRVIDREMVVARREKAAILKDLEVEQKERAAQHTIDTAKVAAKMIDEEQADLQQ
jgi:hypothetical protein